MQASSKKQQIATLREQGYVIAPSLIAPQTCSQLRALAAAQLQQRSLPLEYEADLAYPGAPESRHGPGGETVRRLLDAYSRDVRIAELSCSADIAGWMSLYFGEPARMSRAHHNCIMTKHPRYGSLTGWHRDARYWSFERDDLVSAWIALGPEQVENGGLWLVPGSHLLDFDGEQFDPAKFFRSDLSANQALIHRAEAPQLAAGDVLFFHCNTLHSAGQNLSEQVKFSMVFTYHGLSNLPRPGTRSASLPEVTLGVG